MLSDINHNTFELKLEITSACNAKCSFCHQGFGSTPKIKKLELDEIHYWLLWAKSEGINYIRYTGGEPTLHPDIVKLCSKAKQMGFYVSINTNGLSSVDVLKNIAKQVDCMKISLPSLDSVLLDKITGMTGVFRKKMKAIEIGLLGNCKVELLSVILDSNIGVFKEFIKFYYGIPNLSWTPLRLESYPNNKYPMSKESLQCIAEEFSKLMDEFPQTPKIALAIPFCAISPIALAEKVFSGRAATCGPLNSITVTYENKLISCYGCREALPESTLSDIQKSAIFSDLISFDGLPNKCHICSYWEKCLGGCRNQFTQVKRRDKRIDYLANE